MANKIQIRRDTTANWTASNPILSQGELGLDTTLNKIKIGNGTSNWSALSFYFGDPTSLINGSHTVALNSTGGVNFPTLSVDIHNGGVQLAQVLKFDNASQQVIITGPTPAAGNSAERIIIQGQRATSGGEGGDVYLWGGDSDINGGDIKIYAGDADSDNINGSIGGYVNIDAGNGFTNGGNLTLSAGVARGGENSYGGNVSITAGYAFNGTPGNIQLITYAQSDSANLAWTFTNDGKLQLPAGGDVVNSDGNSVLGGTDIYKFVGGTIGTKANPATSNGWGGYDMYLDPGGESWASIFIPSPVNQDGGASLQILNKGSATSIVQVIGWGGIQLVTNTELNENLFEFGDDGKLTLPADSLIESEISSTISVGAGLAELETTYTNLMLMLDDIFTQIASESGYPWGITLPISVPLTYNQLIQLSPDTFTGQANATTVAHNANTAYNVWQDAAATTNIHVNVSNKSWMFGNDGKLTLPSGNAQIVAESNGGVRIGTANTNVAPNAQIRIGGADHVFEIFGGPPSYSWKFDIDGTTSFPNNSIKNSLDSNTAITTQRTLTANNSYTNVTDFSTDVDLGGGIGVIAGWYQRTLTQIEFSLFGDSTFQSYLTGLALGRTVIVTYNTSGGTATLTRTLTQAFSGTGQTDPNNPTWSRVSGRIDATLPVGQLGIVSINFPVYSTSTNDWTFGADGNLTLPGGIVKLEVDDANPSGGLVVSVDAGVPSGYKSLYKFGRGGQFTSRAISLTNSSGDPVGTIVGDGYGPIISAGAGKEVWVSSDGQHLWRFTADRSFVLPAAGGNIRSEGNINIDVNLTDSTLRRWQFGEDGKLALPNNGKIASGAGTAQVGSTTTIATDSNGGTGAGIPGVVDVAYDNTIIPTYYYPGGGAPNFTDSTITFANGDVRTITSIIATGGYIEIDYSGTTTSSSPGFPIILKTGNFAAATTAPEWEFGTNGTLSLPTAGNIKNGVDITQVGSSLTIANDGSGGLVGWGTNSLSVASNSEILSETYIAAGSTITFQDGVVATITQIDNYPEYHDIFWDTPKTGTLFPITLKTANYVAAVIAPQWTFGTDSTLTFPDGTTATGKSITVPSADSLTVNFSVTTGPLTTNTTFKANPGSIKLPTGNGYIYSGSETNAERWGLDSANKELSFPNGDSIHYGQGGAGLRLYTYTDPIKITVGQTTTWEFGSTGIQFPDASVQTTAYTGTGAVTFTGNQIEGNTFGGTGTIITKTVDNTGNDYSTGSGSLGFLNFGADGNIQNVKAGWTVTFASGVTRTVSQDAYQPLGTYWNIGFNSGYIWSAGNVMPVTFSSPDYVAGSDPEVTLTAGTESWTFDETGRTTFPNGTVPEHSYGAVGDKAGMLVVDATYIYYCTANYNAATPAADIWKRTAHGTGTW